MVSENFGNFTGFNNPTAVKSAVGEGRDYSVAPAVLETPWLARLHGYAKLYALPVSSM